jgi:two-component system, cell cycle response regulator
MAQAGYKVLLVDDDPAMLRLLGRWLEKAGYTVGATANGQEALRTIEADCPDFVLTDWEMPHVSGLELCRQIRGMPLPHYVYTIFLTARTGGGEMIAGLEGGADDFLTKPVAEKELLARLKSGARVLELERKLSLLAHTDSLTGLLTQRAFYELLEKEWHRATRLHLPMSCVMMDLDFFKQINDVHGHPAGDSVLKFAAELLLDTVRASDTVCRYGGEEFCILLPETDENDAMLWAERTRARLGALRIPTELRDMRVTGSFGVAQRHSDTPNAEDLVKLADQALLCAKRTGRDRVVRYAATVESARAKPHATDWHDEVFANMRARDAMNPLVVYLQEDNSIDEAARLFLQSGILSMPVLNSAGTLTGFVSERDLMAATASADRWQKPLSSIMRPNVICYEEGTPIRLIYEFLCRVAIRGVVITKDGQPTGIVNRNSLLRCFYEWSADQDSISESGARASSRAGNMPDTAFARDLRSLSNVLASLSAG